MKRLGAVWAVALGLVGTANADWGSMPTSPGSGKSVKEALGPGYGPPPGYVMPASHAQPVHEGPHPSLLSYAQAPRERPPARYGLNPTLYHWLFWWKKDKNACGSDCKDCNKGHGGGAMYNAGGHNHTNYGPAPQQGTLVFPHHPFVRSPRDYYMTGP